MRMILFDLLWWLTWLVPWRRCQSLFWRQCWSPAIVAIVKWHLKWYFRATFKSFHRNAAGPASCEPAGKHCLEIIQKCKKHSLHSTKPVAAVSMLTTASLTKCNVKLNKRRKLLICDAPQYYTEKAKPQSVHCFPWSWLQQRRWCSFQPLLFLLPISSSTGPYLWSETLDCCHQFSKFGTSIFGGQWVLNGFWNDIFIVMFFTFSHIPGPSVFSQLHFQIWKIWPSEEFS